MSKSTNDMKSTKNTKAPRSEPPIEPVLSGLDMSKDLDKDTFRFSLLQYQAALNELAREARARKIAVVPVFEGWDAGGKGGAIRRFTPALDARDYTIVSIAAPTKEELSHHYLWRFWRQIPPAGRWTIFDRSWYGRVLVERVEGFAREHEWRRAYDEINHFEKLLTEHGIALVKFWLHITPDEQKSRFERRANTPHKSWKLTKEDWRNRERWHDYEKAVDEMVARTNQPTAPWHLIEGNSKRYARVRVLELLCETLQGALDRTP